MIINPAEVPGNTNSAYPKQFQAQVARRFKQKLGNVAGLKNFGVNLVTLKPGSASALRHWHEQQDEFVYVLEGEITLVSDQGEQVLEPGMAAAFPAGEANGHQLVNRSTAEAKYLEVGDRTPNEVVHYPDVDLQAQSKADGWIFTHKDGRPYST